MVGEKTPPYNRYLSRYFSWSIQTVAARNRMDLSAEKKDGSWEPPFCVILQFFRLSFVASKLTFTRNRTKSSGASGRSPISNGVCSCDRRDNDLFLLVLIAHNIQNKNVEVRRIWICYQRSHILSAIIISEASSLLSNSIRNRQTHPNLSIADRKHRFYPNMINLH